MSTFDPFAAAAGGDSPTDDNQIALATPAPSPAPAAPAATPSPFDPFAPKAPTAADTAPAPEPLPSIDRFTLVREPGSEGRVGIVILTGNLEPHPSGQERPAVCVGWFAGVSDPILTDQLEVLS